MRFSVSFESWEGGRSSQVGRQRVPDSRSNVTKRTSPKVFRFVFGILSSLSAEERRERDGCGYVTCRRNPGRLRLNSELGMAEELIHINAVVQKAVYALYLPGPQSLLSTGSKDCIARQSFCFCYAISLPWLQTTYTDALSRTDHDGAVRIDHIVQISGIC